MNCLQKSFINVAAVIFCTIIPSLTAVAQRGSTFEGDAKPWQSPSQGFPGYFDTNVAAKGSVVVDFPPILVIIPMPFMAVDYGVSDTFTVGTNAILTTVPWLFGAVGGTIKIRSLLYGDETHQSAGTYYGGVIATTRGTPLKFYYQVMTWNHSYRLGARHSLSGHVNYTRFNVAYGEETSLERISISQASLMLGGGYGFQISPTWALRLNGISPVIQSIDADTTTAALSQSQTLGNTKSASAIYVAQAEYRASDAWLLGFGLLGFSASGSDAVAPWFSWARRW
jgi:hypothetical protein